ncbi:MAG: hypothetical protein AVDCRST_MAG49-2108 [uncultured Thermomicrobiales bacterium]|uniref:RNA polymerase alpha subunit C-terminal domain-containing protein n=1 Tax=uncultured Thermomicrobiales bacterium TaxID=1645740 RepID=A0A6J4UMK9_9BACT|nr:MAG: hypothetical protein AVDCRST_MAG49-2108 [uncultured Thermomicrobiales bacterium]
MPTPSRRDTYHRGGRPEIGLRYGYQSDLADPFAVNPVRRSLALVLTSAAVVFVPLAIGGAVATLGMLAVGWLGLAGLVMGTPILVWSAAEEGWRRIDRRFHPTVDQLGLSPRVEHVLLRHGYATIDEVERESDAGLLLLSNMDARGLREVRRAVSLWKYRRWQEQGFPATGHD